MIRMGVIGYGYWGPNLVRNFAETGGMTVTSVADLDPKKLEIVQRRFPGVKTTMRFQDLLENKDIDAVAIATPVNSHFELGMAALKAGKHVWLEKPLTETSEQARKLINEAEKRKLVLIVDHTFIYTGAVRRMANLIKSGKLVLFITTIPPESISGCSNAMPMSSPIWRCMTSRSSIICLGNSRWRYPPSVPTTFPTHRKILHILLCFMTLE